MNERVNPEIRKMCFYGEYTVICFSSKASSDLPINALYLTLFWLTVCLLQYTEGPLIVNVR